MACATVRVVHEPGGAALAAPQNPQTVIVQTGDTLYGIASRQGLKVNDLAAWNALSAPYTIKPGQRLQLAPAVATTSIATTTPVSAQSAITSSLLVGSAFSAPTTVSNATKQLVASATTAVTAAGKWQWPAEGTVLRRTSGGDAPGIDIVGHGGAPVRAVADGVVLYSGAGSPGYEELIVIRHDGAWLSSYAHHRKRLVGEGQRVRAGAQIADMGRIGVTQDLLTFEMRRDGGLVDPLTVLPPR
ncbi:peptidoglycan DD-metalloendopeptidase family protein [Lysobacter sp. FW306-1B-D06B]|uniref:peptidoglycan DD-metalloendopeptidase family protein n=1 Tax=Lysobacter sp. FW306-1B-D06B TaxID=3140250 RepID=UPI003140BBD0